MIYFFKTILILLFPSLIFSQEINGWYSLFGNDKLFEKYNIHYELQHRNHNFIGKLDQLLIRGGIGYDLTEKNNNILVGYGFVRNKKIDWYDNSLTDSERSDYLINEHRIFQQFITKQRFGRVVLQHRYRTEQRYINDKFDLRFRYFSNLIVPFNKKEVIARTLYISAYNEVFLNFKDDHFDRNRAYLALGFALTDDVKIEFGYINQYLENDRANIVQVSLFNNLDFKVHR